MSLDFLLCDEATGDGAVAAAAGAPVARTALEGSARAAGARFEVRDGWNVAVAYGPSADEEAQGARSCAGWADVSHLGKLELQAPSDELDALASHCDARLAFGDAVRAGDAWWCRLTPTRALVIAEPARARELRARLAEAVDGSENASLCDVTSRFGAIVLAGPAAREVLARFCSLDLRPQRTPAGALRPGSIARQPGLLICEETDRYLFLFGWATGEYVWTVVSDAGEHLGGRPIGVDAVALLRGSDRGDQDA